MTCTRSVQRGIFVNNGNCHLNRNHISGIFMRHYPIRCCSMTMWFRNTQVMKFMRVWIIHSRMTSHWKPHQEVLKTQPQMVVIIDVNNSTNKIRNNPGRLCGDIDNLKKKNTLKMWKTITTQVSVKFLDKSLL